MYILQFKKKNLIMHSHSNPQETSTSVSCPPTFAMQSDSNSCHPFVIREEHHQHQQRDVASCLDLRQWLWSFVASSVSSA